MARLVRHSRQMDSIPIDRSRAIAVFETYLEPISEGASRAEVNFPHRERLDQSGTGGGGG